MPAYKIDFHVHTDASADGRSSLAAQAAAAKAARLDAIAVTDHNQCTPVPPSLDGMLLIPGCEVSTQAGHITALFLAQPLDLEALWANGLPAPEAAVAEIRRCGGLAVLAHPFQRLGADAASYDFSLDGVETANARAAFKNRNAHHQAADFASARDLTPMGGSDGHAAAEVGNAYTLVEAEALTLSALREAVAAGRCRPVLARDTSHFAKGLSQFAAARRSGSPARLAKGVAYLGYTALLDAARFFTPNS